MKIAGFHDRVRAYTPEELAALEAMPDEEEEFRETLGVSRFIGDASGLAWRERLYGSPTCNISGIEAGYTGPGMKTVLPATARAKVDFRLVPDQTPAEILEKLRAHLDRYGFQDVEVDPISAVARPFRTPIGDPWVQQAARVAEAFYGQPAALVPNTGGFINAAALVDACPGMPIFFAPGGAGYWGSNIHAPNEHIRLQDLPRAIEVTALLLKAFGE